MRPKLAISTTSLGQHVSHTLPQKLAAAARFSFTGVELVFDDLLSFASSNSLSLRAAAAQIKSLCRTHELTILSLNPLKNFEGHSSPLSTRLAAAQVWVDTARELGTSIVQIPSQFDTVNSSGDDALIVSDLRALADLGAKGGEVISFAYEAVAWASYNSLWEDSARVVAQVNRSNFGICLDMFHIAARIWGDPCRADGMAPGGCQALASSLERFRSFEMKDKIFYLQLSDGERFDPPLTSMHKLWDKSMDPKLIWSRYARPFPMEMEFGGYFPVSEIARTWLVDMQLDCWVSVEVFNRGAREEDMGPEKLAERGRCSVRKVYEAIGLDIELE